jgi:SNF2 family DNA or RNA helicase
MFVSKVPLSPLIFIGDLEIRKHLKSKELKLKHTLYHGTARKKQVKKDKYNLIITSFAVVRQEFQKGKWKDGSIFQNRFRRIVLDEAHFIRNASTATSKVRSLQFCCNIDKAVRALDGSINWVVTATPVQNKIDDMYSYMNFLGVYDTPNQWKDDIVRVMKKNPKHGFAKLQVWLSLCATQRLKNMLQELAIRRQKNILKLPPKEESSEIIVMEEIERQFYDALFEYCQKQVGELLSFIESVSKQRAKGR